MSEPVLGFGFTNAFPGLVFDRPVVIASPPGETNRLFIAEKSGRIMVINDLSNPSAAEFLDLRGGTFTSVEAGLLGLAFHPNFTNNGRFFVYRVTQPSGFRDVLSEFRCDPPGAPAADPASERVLLSQRDLSDTHNAGDLKFGPDGYLYLSLGDEGPVFPDTHDTPQAIDKGFFAGIIRIDVDLHPENLPPNPHPAIEGEYRVPRDNPFIGAETFNGLAVDPSKVRTEFFAVGMRNPWRFTFDPFTGELICADVGAGAVEEINLVRKGGNYGWPYLEGTRPRVEGILPNGLEAPIYEYPHSVGLFGGRVVIGGLVCADDRLPGLQGHYLFADYESGNVWAIDHHAAEVKPRWLAARSGLSTFGVHPADGTVLAANHLAGRIERLVHHSPEESGIPPSLHDTGLFSDPGALQPAAALFPFEVINPLWSDGADKFRWADFSQALGPVDAGRPDRWEIPQGAVFVKHFELELTKGVPSSRRRLETRVLVRTADDVYGLTYRWGDSLTNAYLVPPEGTNETFVVNDSGVLKTQVWSYPSWDQCRTCHNKEAGYILGFRANQLNRPVSIQGSVTNQLAWLAAQGLFGGAVIEPAKLPSLAGLDDPFAPAAYRARSYLESNCMQCHVPGGRSGALWDARVSTPLALARIVGSPPLFYPPPAKLIDPGVLTNSYMLQRVETRTPFFQMPPLATSVPDDQFLSLLRQWIVQIPDSNWQTADFGPARAEGAAAWDQGTLRVSGAGDGLEAGSFFFAWHAAFGSSGLSARLKSLGSASARAEAGLMLRQSLAADAPAAALLQKEGQLLFLLKRDVASPLEIAASLPASEGAWLKLVSDGAAVSAWVSGEGLDWRLAGSGPAALGTNYLAGFTAASAGEASQFASADFSDITLVSVALDETMPREINLPGELPLGARVSVFGEPAPVLTFREGASEIAAAAPWSAVWTNPPEGELRISALLSHASMTLTSAPVVVQAAAPATQAWLKGQDRRTLGDWSPRYGQDGHWIPGGPDAKSPSVLLEVLNGTFQVLGSVTNRSALQSGNDRIASVFHSASPLEIRARSQDYGVHQLSLYFRDWLGAGATQTVNVLDGRTRRLIESIEVIGQPGVYVPLVFRNEVIVQIVNGQGDAYLTGIFLDPVPPLSVDLSSPQDGLTLVQPASVELNVTAMAPGRDVLRVEIWEGSDQFLVMTNPPFRAELRGIFPGTRQYRAVGYGTYGISGQSYPVEVTVLAAEPAAEFLGMDSRSQGSWKTRYGEDGWWLFGEGQVLPRPVEIASPDGRLFYFTGSTDEIEALQRPYGDDRFAACLTGAPEFSLSLKLLDGEFCTVGMYFVDWGNSHRAMEIVAETPGGAVLDRRELHSFAGGRYLFWRVRGEVRFRLISRSINAVVSGVFFDRDLTGYEIAWNDNFGLDGLEGVDPEDADGDGFSNALEYFLGYDLKSAEDRPQFRYSLGGGWFQISLTQRTEVRNLALRFEASTDLVNWAPASPVSITQKIIDGVRLTYHFPADGKTRQFIRYSVTAR